VHAQGVSHVWGNPLCFNLWIAILRTSMSWYHRVIRWCHRFRTIRKEKEREWCKRQLSVKVRERLTDSKGRLTLCPRSFYWGLFGVDATESRWKEKSDEVKMEWRNVESRESVLLQPRSEFKNKLGLHITCRNLIKRSAGRITYTRASRKKTCVFIEEWV
jgi:hypothetical protein